jgi:hypothetical protein
VLRKIIPVRGANVARRALHGRNAGGSVEGPPVRAGRGVEKGAGDSTSEPIFRRPVNLARFLAFQV